MQKRKDGLFHKWFWENWIFTHKRMELDSYLTSYTEMKWIKDLNVPETVKLLKNKKKKKGKISLTLVFTMVFYGYDTQSASNKSKNQLGIYQTKETSL